MSMFKRHIILSGLALLLSAGVDAKIFRQEAGNLVFAIGQDATGASFAIKGHESDASEDSEFWRLILDDGLRREIPVISTDQTGKVSMEGDGLVIRYGSLVSEYGDTYPVSFTVNVRQEDGLLKFSAEIENNTENVRVNECFCPMADFNSIAGDKAEDVLYWPQGPGERYVNPWKLLEDKAPYYYAHDEYETYMNLVYPRASMSWYGVESGDKFLYFARYDKDMRQCLLSIRHRIDDTNLTFTVDHFPMARSGEKVDVPASVIGVIDGDWRDGADIYRAWADSSFYKAPEVAPWVRRMTGFQRIIMRSQYGLDYYKAEDLPAMYEAGAKYGIRTLFLFGWWKGGMDRDYPYYDEPYPGAFKELGDNIRKVQEMGGRVILECNCHFLDPQVDYYSKFGHEVEILDINGDPVPKSFVYQGRGELREKLGAKLFYLACAGTQRWRNQLMSQLRLMDSMGPDCLFIDCYGFCPYQPCFNHSHEHGYRVDEEWKYHRIFFNDAVRFCNDNGRVLATEGVTDLAGAYNQFLHGNIGADFKIKSNAYPQMFRYTFPEVITTVRNIYSSQGDYERQFRNALTMGMRLDAQLWVCRADISRDPAYAKAVGEYTALLDRYGEFFYDGKFTVIDRSELPYSIKRTEWYSKDSSKVMRVLYNSTGRTISEYCGVTLGPGEIRFDIFNADDYCR